MAALHDSGRPSHGPARMRSEALWERPTPAPVPRHESEPRGGLGRKWFFGSEGAAFRVSRTIGSGPLVSQPEAGAHGPDAMVALQLGLVVASANLAHVERMECITVYLPVSRRPGALLDIVLASSSGLALDDGEAVAGATTTAASLGGAR